MATSEFRLHQGPIFTDLLLVDEINRMPPRTQAALLEAMEERQVTIDGAAARAVAALHRRRDAEPGRVRGHLSAARSGARSVRRQDQDRVSGRGRTKRRSCARHQQGLEMRRADGRRSAGSIEPERPGGGARRGGAPCASSRRCSATSPRSRGGRANGRRSRSARARARAIHLMQIAKAVAADRRPRLSAARTT